MALSAPVKLGLVAILGALICAAGGIMYALFPGIIEGKVKNTLRLVEGTDTFKAWKEPPVPIYMQFYLFNVTNAKDVQESGSKPIVEQCGPYTYREYRKKRNITWFDDYSLISFYQDKYFVFEANMSVGSEDDLITTINIPIVTVTQKLKNANAFVKVLVNNVLYKDGIFTTKTVGEFFFKGYKIDIVDKIQKITKATIMPNATFGIMYGKNYTDDGLYTINSGVGGVKDFAYVNAWNNSKILPYWQDKYCDMINGSDGSSFPPFVSKDSILYIFSTDLCRSIYVTYEDERIIEGIKAYRFTPPFKLLADQTINPDNICFCAHGFTCGFAGVLNISSCRKGAPLVLSGPHFYQSDVIFQESIIGLNPNKFEHETLLDIEPTTGLVVNAARRIQVNVALEPVKGLKITEKLPQMLFPIFWLNESARLTPEVASKFKAKLQTPVLIGTAVIYALIGVGAFIVLCVILYGLICYKDARQPVKNSAQINMPHLVNDPAAAVLLKPSKNQSNHEF